MKCEVGSEFGCSDCEMLEVELANALSGKAHELEDVPIEEESQMAIAMVKTKHVRDLAISSPAAVKRILSAGGPLSPVDA